MTDLPPGWEWATLGEIAETNLGKMLNKSQQTGQFKTPYLRNINVRWHSFDLSNINEMDISLTERSKYMVEMGDLLVCEGGEVGRCAVWKIHSSQYAIQNALHRIRPYAGVDSQYLAFFLENLANTNKLNEFSTGVTIKHLVQERLRKIPVPLPAYVEQQRIVATLEDHLSRLDAGCSILRSLLTRIESYRERFIITSCTGSGAKDTETFAESPPPAGVQDGDIPSIPANWRWARLGEIADVVGGVTKDAKKQSDPDLLEVPYLRVANVQRGYIDLNSVARIKVPPAVAEKLRLQHGDVLLNEGGDRDKLARGWIWERQLPLCIHQNHVFRARILDNVLHPKLLAWHTNSFGKKWAEANGKQSVNLASISLSKIKLLPVPVPPLAEQEELVSYIENHLSVLDRQAETITIALSRATQLRRSLLTEAFAGQLAPQDPNDEPASVLLERIRKERDAAPKPKRARRTAAKPKLLSEPVQETLL